MSKPKRKLLFPAFESFPVIVGTGGDETKGGTRIRARIREIIPGTGSPWNSLDLSSIVFMNGVNPLKDRWRVLSLAAWPPSLFPNANPGLPSNRETMHEYVWRKACRLDQPAWRGGAIPLTRTTREARINP